MDSHIHDILMQAGVAKGITADEAGVLMILANDDLLELVKKNIRESAKKGEFTPEEAERAILDLEDMSVRYKNAQKNVVETFEACEKKFFEDRKQKFQKLQEAFDDLFPQVS